MRTRPLVRLGVAALLLSLGAPVLAAQGAQGCSAFKWNVAHEVALFSSEPRNLIAGANPDAAPSISADQLYTLDLKPQEGVHYAAPASKKMLPDGAFGGVLHLKVAKAGQYRVSIDSGFWLDVIHQGKALPAVDFNGSPTCAGPRKIVVYDLPADSDLVLQIGNASTAKAKLTVTPIDAAH